MTLKTASSTKNKTPMTAAAVLRIKSATAKVNGGLVPKKSFAARAESTASKIRGK